jgi:LysM repeat protein
MKHFFTLEVMLGGLFVCVLGACSQHPANLETPVDRQPAQLSAPPPQPLLLQEARNEAEHLRAEVASLKILAAKQSGELQLLQNRSQSVHQREQDQGQQLQQIRAQLFAAQEEGDRLRQRNADLEGQIQGVADISPLLEEIQALQASFQHIKDNLQHLTTDVTLIKQKMQIAPRKAEPRHTKATGTHPGGGFPESHSPDATGHIVIRKGDTLWQLANQYHVTINQLKDWNGLQSDVIRAGLRFRVTDTPQPAHSESQPELTTSASPQKPQTSVTHEKPVPQESPEGQRKNPPGQEMRQPSRIEHQNLLSISPPPTTSRK